MSLKSFKPEISKIAKSAGKLKLYLNKWKTISHDPWVIKTISGYKIDFVKQPVQNIIPNSRKFNKEEIKLIDQEIHDLLQKGAIKNSTHEKGEFISNIFLVSKKNGKFRPVINLKKLNKFVEYHHFKQETLDVVLKSIKKGSFLTSLDLTDAYFSIPMHFSCIKYLKFIWKNKLYAFQCLPFGISSAPRVFTKIMKVVFSHIRSLGISSFFYIDDSLLQAIDYEESLLHTQTVKEFIESLGFSINLKKSSFIPSQRIVFLGYIIDTVLFKVFLPEEKIEKILDLSNKILKKDKITIRSLAQLIGLYASSYHAILLAHLNHRYLDIDKTNALKQSNNNYNSKLVLSYQSKSEITWWINNIIKENGVEIRQVTPYQFLETDASLSGWGAIYNGISTQGRWNFIEQHKHINFLELKAIYFGLKALCCQLENIHICIKTDSSTAVSYINNQGGPICPLLDLTKSIWNWCREKNIFLSAVHIAGKLNTAPDNLSRIFKDTSEWKLKDSIFERITLRFFHPNIDLFASRLNKQLNNYVSWFPDPEASHTDAFSFSWHELTPYIFPPFSQIGRVLQKLEDDQVRKAIIIVPLWTTQFWYPKFLQSLIDFPLKLPQCSDLLSLVHSGETHPMNKRKMFLCACIVSGDISLIQDFQNKLQTSSLDLGDYPLIDNMNIAGVDGFCGAVQNKLIPLHHL